MTFCPDLADEDPAISGQSGELDLSFRLAPILDAQIRNEADLVLRVQWSRRVNEVLDSIEVRETSSEIGLRIGVRSLPRRATLRSLAAQAPGDAVRTGLAPEGAVQVWSEVILQEPMGGRALVDDSGEGSGSGGRRAHSDRT